MSLASSASINPALAWSKGPRKFQPQLIRFPAGWTSRIGSVFQWYDELPSKHFTRLQYRKEYLKPFLHEFVLLILLDGYVCRFERVGDPNARTEALATSGSIAHDLVQLFPPGYLDTIDLTSSLVVELEFPKRFDILDVIAICYAVRQGEKTRRYTLQRFNCYFFSWTILTILTRQLAQWGCALTGDAWPTITSSMIRSLQKLSTSNTADRHKYELTFRICQLLNPANPEPARFLLEQLQERLNIADVQNSVVVALSNALWRSEWGFEISASLREAIRSAAQSTVDETTLAGLVSSCNRTSRAYGISKIIFDAEINQSLLRNMGLVTQRYKEELKEVHEEQFATAGMKRVSPMRSVRRGIQSISGAAYGVWTYRWTDPAHIYSKASMALAKPWDSPSTIRRGAAALGAAWRVLQYFVIDKMDDAKRGVIKAQSVGFEVEAPELNFDDTRDEALSETLSRLETERLDDIEHVASAVQEFLSYEYTTWENHWSRWVWNSVNQVLRDDIVGCVLAGEQKTLTVRIAHISGAATQNTMSVSEFHDLVHVRVKEHANRVSSHGLGSAGRIRNDIEAAISSVWRSLPEPRNPVT